MAVGLAEQIAAGDVRALARAASWVENRRPQAEQLLKEMFPRTGRALILGVTGAPGAGKSTLCDQLIRVLRVEGKTVGVVAVDPSSPYTGGAILGDRIRMQQHHDDPGVFIRSMATRGWMGGLARATTEMTMLLDAAGRDVVIVETVGVGQDEVDVVSAAETAVVVTVPGLGDEIQAIKAGILEIADVLVVNKSDHEGADRTVRDLIAMLELRAPSAPPVEIVRTVATEGKGIDELVQAIERHRARGANRRVFRAQATVRELVVDRLRKITDETLAKNPELVESVATRATDPYTAANEILTEVVRKST